MFPKEGVTCSTPQESSSMVQTLKCRWGRLERDIGGQINREHITYDLEDNEESRFYFCYSVVLLKIYKQGIS